MVNMQLFEHFKAILNTYASVIEDQTIVLGVSGGADSLAMLHLFVQVKYPVYVVHVDHMLRGENAAADAAFVVKVCKQWNIPFKIVEVDVPNLVETEGYTIEEAARKARYTALTEAATDIDSRVIAVAHNANDQAETLLMYLIRGSGMQGLSAMRVTSALSVDHLLGNDQGPQITILRPLLGVGRGVIEEYCAAHDLEPRIDASNIDVTYTRNRIRNELLPLLEDFNPNIIETLNRTADIVSEDYVVIEQQVKDAWKSVARVEDHCILVDIVSWRELSVAIQRQMIRYAVHTLKPEADPPGYEQTRLALHIAQSGTTGKKAQLVNNLWLHVDYEYLIVADTYDAAYPLAHQPQISTPFIIDSAGTYSIPGTSWQIGVSLYHGPRRKSDFDPILQDRWQALLNTGPPYVLRPRKPYDRFYPQGAGGSQSIKKFMNAAKIPSNWRDEVPLLTSDDEIAWVCGWRVDERYIVTELTENIWYIRWIQTKTRS